MALSFTCPYAPLWPGRDTWQSHQRKKDSVAVGWDGQWINNFRSGGKTHQVYIHKSTLEYGSLFFYRVQSLNLFYRAQGLKSSGENAVVFRYHFTYRFGLKDHAEPDLFRSHLLRATENTCYYLLFPYVVEEKSQTEILRVSRCCRWISEWRSMNINRNPQQ